jgi:hypothetical protein
MVNQCPIKEDKVGDDNARKDLLENPGGWDDVRTGKDLLENPGGWDDV